jgi:arylsulfatase
LNGTFVHELSHLIDVVPTLLDLTGAKYPKSFNGHKLVPLSGRSFAAIFRGQRLGKRSAPLFWAHQGNRAVRTEDWKVVCNWGHPWNLYRMAVDRSETDDLAEKEPAKLFEMTAQWYSWAQNTDVDPWTDQYNNAILHSNGTSRQNWGGTQQPRYPDAMDRQRKW